MRSRVLRRRGPSESAPRPRRHIETVTEASKTDDIDWAFEGFLIDQQVRTLGTEDARELFAELVAAEEEYLEGSAVLAESEAFA